MKKMRVVISVVIFTLITLYFLDFAGLLPQQLHQLTRLQLIPALLALNIGALAIILLLTILFGRFYCSSICPMGVLQDIVNWMAKKMERKKKYLPRKENKLLRWSIVFMSIIAFFAGSSIIVSILDPYSAYGRIATTLFKPIYLSGNNIIAWVGEQFKNYRFYQADILLTSISALAIAAVTLLVIAYLSFKWGRLYCNTICPVGTVLGFFSKYAIFKININHTKCNSCGLCSMKCKSSCIDSATQKIDYSRCVTCFNCIEACNRHAMAYQHSFIKRNTAEKKGTVETYNTSKRTFFISLFTIGLAGVEKIFANKGRKRNNKDEIYTGHNVAFKRAHPITPPGSQNVRDFNSHCTACHLCVSKCPSNVLKPAMLEYGIIGMLQPVMNFEHGYCNYHCTLCTEICPANALKTVSATEKKTLQVGHVHYVKENCVVVTDGTDCGACSEHCPTQAVSMKPYKKGLRIPTIDQNLCVGCGGCEYICPTRPYRAIYVVGNPVHKQALIPEENDKKEIEVNDFGF